MSASSGKVTIIAAFIGSIGAIGAASIANIEKIENYFISDAPKVSFYKTEFYKGDKNTGGFNSCEEKYILVSEIYKISDENIDDIVFSRSTPIGYKKDTTKVLSPRGIDGLFEYNFFTSLLLLLLLLPHAGLTKISLFCNFLNLFLYFLIFFFSILIL